MPATVDDYIGQDNPIRAVDQFVDSLGLAALKFKVKADSSPQKGRPGYHPATMLKLYLWGYLNQIRSIRKLERACGRNVEVMWLLQKMTPDHSIISDFRKTNAKALNGVFKHFNALCLECELFSWELVAIDGTFIKAVNSRHKSFTKTKLKKQIERVEKAISKWMKMLDTTDADDPGEGLNNADSTSGSKADATAELQEKIARLTERNARYEDLLAQCEDSSTGQINETDPDARQLCKGEKWTVGYNVQSTVEDDNHLIVDMEVTQEASDIEQLNTMAQQAKAALNLPADAALTVLADKVYGSGSELAKCEENGTYTCVPVKSPSAVAGDGSMPLSAFEYLEKEDAYQCPQGAVLPRRNDFTSVSGVVYRTYYDGAACRDCPLLKRCTKSKYRKLSISEHQGANDANLARLAANSEAYGRRCALVEHPFGTIKADGCGNLLCRGLELATAEMALSCWSYNFKRVSSLLSFSALMDLVSGQSGQGAKRLLRRYFTSFRALTNLSESFSRFQKRFFGQSTVQVGIPRR
ncbi:IS1182 family transposase [bacterium]|nr:IS1182 family transposase [bacterium]MDC0314611.1 IS1182 family transposase [bacterium]